jgi:hypothetical protein
MGTFEQRLVTDWDPKKDFRVIKFVYKLLSKEVYKDIFFDSMNVNLLINKDELPSVEKMTLCLREFEDYIWGNRHVRNMFVDWLEEACFDSGFLRCENLTSGEVTYPALSKTNDKKLKDLFRYVFLANSLMDSDFDWIDTSNDRQCNFVWAMIRTMEKRDYVSDDAGIVPVESWKKELREFSFFEYSPCKQDEYTRRCFLYETFCGELNYSTNQKTKSKVIEFFDCVSLKLDGKNALNTFLKHEWKNRSKNVKFISWLKKNEELSVWVYNYLLKVYFDGQHPRWGDLDFSSDVKHAQSCRAIAVTFFDILSMDKYQHELLDRVRRNGRQQKAREKLKRIKNEKSERTINISRDVNDKLQVIAQLRDCKKEDVVEQLIKHVYAKLKEKSAIGG